MEEFIKSMYLPITYFVEFLAVFIGILRYKKFKGSPVAYFIIFLIIVVSQEFVSGYTLFIKDGPLHFLEGTVFEKNHWIGKFVWVIGCSLFYTYFYNQILKTKNFKIVLNVLCAIFIVVTTITIILDWRALFESPQPVLQVMTAIIVITGSGLYFIEVLNSEKVLTFYNSIYFYISCANLLWWLLITPVVYYHMYFNIADWNFIILKWQIYLFANVFMYLTYAYALNFCKPEHD